MTLSDRLESKPCGHPEVHRPHRWWWQEASEDETETFGPTHHFTCPGVDGTRRVNLGLISMIDPRVTLVLHPDGRVTWEENF